MPEIITSSDAQYAFDIVQTICRQVGPGIPGSLQERERAAMIRKELESHLGVENVMTEEFTFAPGAFLGSQHLSAIFTLIAVLLNISVGHFVGISLWIASVAALVFSTLPVILFIFQFILAFELIDPLFKQKPSVNVIGSLRKPGTKNVKRLLILSGHHDSAWEDNWLRLLGYGFFFASTTFLIGIITVLVLSGFQLTGVITGKADILRFGTLGWVLLVFPVVPSIIFSAFFHRQEKNGGSVPGAVDNLSASAAAAALCRFLVNNPSYIPDDTEIRFVSFGSEEAGLRGSRRYVSRHLDELKRLDVRLLNFEMIAYPKITILTSDKNGALKNSPEVVKSAVAAAQRAGVPYKVQAASLGTCTDAASFSQAGLKAITLIPFKMPQQMVAFYHQRWDGPQNLTIDPLSNVLKLALEWVRSGGE
jgi:hypothetical protein